MPMTDEERRQRREERSNLNLLAKVQKCGCLTKTMSPNGGNSGSYFSFPDGRVAPEAPVYRLIQDGRLKPSGDGLFGESQTYVPS